MVKNYITIMVRQLLANKAYFLINLSGLTIGLVCAVLAIAFLFYEFSFDQFHEKGDRIYRLAKKNVSTTTGESSLNAETSGMMGITLKKDYGEVSDFVRVQPWYEDVLVSNESKNFKVSPWVFTDDNFFEVFDFDLLRGDPEDVLKNPSSVVLTTSIAEKLFPGEDPVGKTLVGMNDLEFVVTGIVADPPKNSHIRFEVLVSWSTTVPGVGPLSFDFMNNWLGQTLYTYLLLEEKADPKVLESKFIDFMQRNFPQRAENYFLFLQPLSDVYLHSYDFLYSRFPMGSIRLLVIFLSISMVVLIIACFNYININTARSSRRSAEVGIRKVLGARRRQLLLQHLGESYLLLIVALVLSVLLVDISMPAFNSIVGSTLSLSNLFIPEVVAVILTIVVVVGLLAGLYPAILISGYRPSSMIRSSGTHSKGNNSRQVLTLVQFAVSITLIIVSLIIMEQYNFLKNYDLGFEKDKVLVVSTDNSISESPEAFRNELLSNKDIAQVSICQAAIGTGTFGSTVIPSGMTEEMSTQIFRVDKNFLETYNIELVQGRWFNSELDSGFSVVINETFARQAGWNQLSEMSISNPDSEPTPVIGVIKDINYRPLNEVKVDPILLYIANRNFSNASIRVSGNNLQETLAHIEATYNKFEKRHPFEYYFVDDWFDRQYKAQDQFMKIVSIFTSISILLACLGLYGLTSYTLESRLREIGIRKVLGATVSSILITVNKRFLMLLLLSVLVGIPTAYYFGQQWLNDFPYRVDISIATFVYATIAALGISIFTVSAISVKAANSNPATILKQE